MFKVAPRYLSGVSVFLGDDITRRESNGELVFFVGQATKGPRVPVVVNSVDSAVGVYGANNPLVKAMHQFWDGYLDSAQDVPVRLVGLRVGGAPAQLTTSFGVVIETADAYDGVENDYYVYIDNTQDVAAIKVWDKNKLPVYNSETGLDTNHVVVTGTLDELGGIFGKDIDNDPNDIPVTLKQLADLDVVAPNGVATKKAADGPFTPGDTSVVIGAVSVVPADLVEAADAFPSTGVIEVSAVVGAKTYKKLVPYTAFDGIDTFTIASTTFGAADPFVLVGGTAVIAVKFLASVLQAGDSELNLTKQEKYEYFRSSLSEMEQYTPDYVIPAGVTVDEVDTVATLFSKNTSLISDITVDAASFTVDAASTWPSTGTVTVDSGLVDKDGASITQSIKYSAIAVNGADYDVTIAQPTLAANATAAADSLVLQVKDHGTNGFTIASIPASGFLKSGSDYYYYSVDADLSDDTQKTLNVQYWDEVANTAQAGTGLAYGVETEIVADADVVFTNAIAEALASTVSTTWTQDVELPLGIGYVKETESGGSIIFEWSPTGSEQEGYGLAHFGYLFAKFCNDATLGFNIPLCGINTSMPAATTRSGIVTWLGSFPAFKEVSGGVEAVLANGTGLLGDAALVGSLAFNRSYMTDVAAGVFADPAYGFLLTDTGFINGAVLKDGYGNVVDLGKFLCAGAGVLTFRHGASSVAYNDTCGVYAIGMLSGTPKNEGISFGRIGTGSNVTVGVIISRKYYNDLAKAGYIVITREKGIGWVVNNDPSCAREDSGYYLISTTRTIKAVVESKRSILVGFIGKSLNRYTFEAARTKLADSFKKDVSTGYLKGYSFDLQVSEAAKAIGKLYLRCSLNPPLELTQVDIDTVIDRNVNVG
jgi:hypothetical protein